jgi:hypothetical protein
VSLWGSTGLPITKRPAQARQSLLSGVDEVRVTDVIAVRVVPVACHCLSTNWHRHILTPQSLTFSSFQAILSLSLN